MAKGWVHLSDSSMDNRMNETDRVARLGFGLYDGRYEL
jgi:hypothetical protein